MHQNSIDVDIMQECLASDYLNKVLTWFFHTKMLTTVTKYLIEVIDIRQRNMYLQLNWIELHFGNKHTTVSCCENIL